MSTIQTVQGALSRTNIMAKAEKDQANKAGEKKEPTFHQKQRMAKAADPDNTAYQNAKDEGDVQAATFLATLKHSAHPDHEKNLQVFKNEHGMDPRKTNEAFRAKACRDRGVGPYENQDPAYEQNVVKPWRPTGNTSATQIGFFNNMIKALQAKHAKVGYSGDKAFIESYASKYGLTRNNKDSQMQKIQPKE